MQSGTQTMKSPFFFEPLRDLHSFMQFKYLQSLFRNIVCLDSSDSLSHTYWYNEYGIVHFVF